LRWEFGFTCAFCLLHESDLAYGAEGLGVTGIEHFVPVSASGEINKYENCFYTCRLCNGSRANSPLIDGRGRRLLEPCNQVWSDHFEIGAEGRLRPSAGDADAAYTHEAYDLDDPRKRELRQVRAERLGECLQVLMEGPELLVALMDRLQTESLKKRPLLLRVAEQLRASIQAALREVSRYSAVPRDADASCRCSWTDHHQLPSWLAEQILEVPVP
jgi:hypothetical protein